MNSYLRSKDLEVEDQAQSISKGGLLVYMSFSFTGVLLPDGVLNPLDILLGSTLAADHWDI